MSDDSPPKEKIVQRGNSMSPLGHHMAWRQRVDIEKHGKKSSLQKGIQLGYISKIDMKDLKDENSFRTKSQLTMKKIRQIKTDAMVSLRDQKNESTKIQNPLGNHEFILKQLQSKNNKAYLINKQKTKVMKLPDETISYSPKSIYQINPLDLPRSIQRAKNRSNLSYDNNSPVSNSIYVDHISKLRLKNLNSSQQNHENNVFQRQTQNKSSIEIKPFAGYVNKSALNNSSKFQDSSANYQKNSFLPLPPFALTNATGIPQISNKLSLKHLPNRIIDNSPLLLIGADSTLNNKIVRGDRYNKRMNILSRDSPDRSYMKSKIDLSFPDQTFQMKNKISINNNENLLINDIYQDIDLQQGVMNVMKDNSKPHNKIMSSQQYLDGKRRNNRQAPAEQRGLEESEDNPTTSRRLINASSYQTIDPNVHKSYALPSRDAFLSVNMKIDGKRHREESQPYLKFQTSSLSQLNNSYQEYEPSQFSGSQERIQMAKERFTLRRDQFLEKKRIKQSNKAIKLMMDSRKVIQKNI